MSVETDLLQYPALSYLRWLGIERTQSGICKANLAMVFITAGILLLCSSIDGTLLMRGRAVGLLEHPGVWLFLIGQAVIPWILGRSLWNFQKLSGCQVFTDRRLPLAVLRGLTRDMGRRSPISKSLYSVLAGIGVCAWMWNTYQNQLAFELAGFDFWDSDRHFYGYWSTRVWKLVVWVAFFPMTLHALAMLMLYTRVLLRRAIQLRKLMLQPYHPDKCGGMGSILTAAFSPVVVIIILAAALNFGAIFVHGKLDVTTIGGLFLSSLVFVVLYLVPAAALRNAIHAEKARQLEEIANSQGSAYSAVLADLRSPSALSMAVNLKNLEELAAHIQSVPQWPQAASLIRALTFYWSSPFLGWLAREAGGRLLDGSLRFVLP